MLELKNHGQNQNTCQNGGGCLLKQFKWGIFEDAIRLELVTYILKNAKVLEKMTIRAGSLHLTSGYALQKEISMFPQGSTKCQVEFQFSQVAQVGATSY